MTGGGNRLLSKEKPQKSQYHGGILIEFAFSIPILISLLFFACDHYRFYELHDKVKTSTYLAASMVQQIGNARSNKQLTSKDFSMISYASCLNFFHTNTMFNPWPFGIYIAIDYYYVKRLSKNEYQYQQCWGTSSKGNSPLNMTQNCENLKTISLDDVKDLHTDLVCNKDGEERVLIECCYRRVVGFHKSRLGFFLLEPKSKSGRHGPKDSSNSWNIYNFFVYQLVITPKPGLFPAKN